MGALLLPLLALGASAITSGVGAGIAAGKNKKAREEEGRMFNQSMSTLDMMRYQDPLTMAGNKSLLKLRDEQRQDNLDAMQNRAAAGGATYENQLAAMKNENRADSEFTARLLQSEDARRMALDQQKLNLQQQHSQNVQNNYNQDAQNWNNWGAATAGAFADFGSTALYAGMKGVDTSWEGIKNAFKGD